MRSCIVIPITLCVSLGLAATTTQQWIGYFHTALIKPVVVVGHPTDPTLVIAGEQSGRIRVVSTKTWAAQWDLLDLRSAIGNASGEQGLLGLALAPDFAASGRFFVSFTNASGEIVVSRFRSAGLVADPASRFDLRWGSAARSIPQPQPARHGGSLSFGPNGFVWIALGDGGAPLAAQDDTQLLGKLLELDVNVPDSDPVGYRSVFKHGSGLRSPNGLTFDDPARGGFGAMIFGDAGELWQEIDMVTPQDGAVNFGWPYRDGAADSTVFPPPPSFHSTDPAWRYSSAAGVRVVGGIVYHGRKFGRDFLNRYFFADASSGRMWTIALHREDPPLERQYFTDVRDHTNDVGYGTRVGITSMTNSAVMELVFSAVDNALSGWPEGLFTMEPDYRFQTPLVPLPWARSDVDGDNRSDLLVWRSSNATFYSATSLTGYVDGSSRAFDFVSASDVPFAGDMDGDGTSDLIVWRPSSGRWDWTLSTARSSPGGSTTFGNGALGDVPLVGDLDGDRLADLVIWRPSNGTWYWLPNGVLQMSQMKQWGNQALGDVPLLGDMDGDGKDDLIVWRASTGTWIWTTARSGFTDGHSQQFGNQGLGDVPLSGDIDGDGLNDLIVWRASNGTFYWVTSSSGFTAGDSRQWGSQALGDTPCLGDFDGDRKSDLVVWRPGNGTWYWLTSGSHYSYAAARSRQFGNRGLGDVPIMK